MGRRFCVRCGREEDEQNPIIDGLCPQCFVKERYILKLPSKVTVTVCPVCGSVYVGGVWERQGGGVEDAVELFINRSLIKRSTVYPGISDVRVEVLKLSSGKAFLKVIGFYRKVRLEQDAEIYVDLRKQLCPTCASIRGEKTEATIQIRMEGEVRPEILRKVGNRVGRIRGIHDGIVEIKEDRNGVDIKLNDVSLARQIASMLRKEFSARIKQTWKDSGYVGGKRHGKLTISVRLPGMMRGDIVEFAGSPAVVTGVGKGYVSIRMLDTGRSVRLTHDDLWKRGVRILTEKDYAVIEGTLVNYEGGRAVVQAISSGNVFYVKAPAIFDLGDRVKILIYKGNHYLLI